MESAKVKEIKSNLKAEISIAENYEFEYRSIKLNYLQDILTLINELESENKSLQDLCNKTYEDLTKEIDRLESENESCHEVLADLKTIIKQQNDRIAELEKEIKENPSYAKGYADGIKNTYEVVIPDKLKQFAEMLKEKMGVREYMGVKYKQGVFSENDINETLKEFLL